MANIGDLTVNLVARTGKFAKGMRKATSRITGFASSVTRTIGKVGGFAGALGALVTGGGMALLVKRSFSAIDATAKLADQIGETTENIVGLQHAAELTGVGSEGMNQALQVMQKRLGEVAIKGSGAAKDALEKLGLNVQELIKMSPAQQFRTIAEATSQLTTASERNAVAANIFSRANQNIVNTLALGSEGLRRTRAEADALGMTFTRIEAAKVEMANDAFNKLKEVFGSVAKNIAIRLAPMLKWVADKLTAFAKSGGIKDMVGAAFKFISLAIAKAADVVRMLRVGWHAAMGGIRKVTEWVLGFILSFVQKVLQAVQWLVDKLAAAAEFIPFFGDEAAGALQKVSDGIDKAIEKTGEFKEAATDVYGKAASDSFEKMKDLMEQPPASEGVMDFFKDVEAQADKSARQIADARDKMTMGAGAPTPAAATAGSGSAGTAQIIKAFTAFGGGRKGRQPVEADPRELELLTRIDERLASGNLFTPALGG
jgi:hypothetical protein